MINGKPLIGIVAGRASENVQKMMLEGIMTQAKKYGMYTAVISNIYNFYNFQEYFGHLEVENKIYELVDSPRFDGIIVMAETLSSTNLRPMIIERLKALDIPIVVAGDVIEGYPCVNNDIPDDFREITRHLTDAHGFTEIDILTGQKEIYTSQERVQGVRDVMEEKGIPFGEENVIYGDYWTTGGEQAADEYINGTRRLPQAIICANDFMAYGLIDRFLEYDIKVPEMVSVVGYEYVGERNFHFPLLSTYLRNRSAIGAKAVSILNRLMTGAEEEDIPVSGCMVCGDTCTCGVSKSFLMKELREIRTEKFYNNMTICGNFEQQLAMCRSLSDYIRALQDYAYLIRDLDGMYLCLYENWSSLKDIADLGTSSNEEMMALYRIISPIQESSEPHYYARKMLFPDELPGAGDDRFLYFVPMFTNGIEIGYLIFQYTKPDGYDTLMIDWVNSAVNALNVLRMKNDINELLEYNNLSAFHDNLTGFYNKNGLLCELARSLSKADRSEKVSVVVLKTSLFSDEIRIDEKGTSLKLDLEIAESMKKLAALSNAICAKLTGAQFVYAVIGDLPEDYDEIIADRLTVLVSHSPLYKISKGIDSIISSGMTVDVGTVSAEEIMRALSESITQKTETMSRIRKKAGFSEFNSVRSSIYRSPEQKWDAENECRDFHLSCGHFRAAYKNMFGISFHRDLIQSRIALAKYLLMTTALSLPAIAAKCGYEDDKYFLRQFRQQTGISPNAYRKFEITS